MKKVPAEIHPEGENPKSRVAQMLDMVAVDTYGGRVYINWDHETAVTSLGQLSFFIEFLKRTELFDRWVESCPLELTCPRKSGDERLEKRFDASFTIFRLDCGSRAV